MIAVPDAADYADFDALLDFSFYHQFTDYDMQMRFEFIVRNVFMGWNFSFEGFRSAADGTVRMLYWVLCYAMMPVFSFLGYWAGMNRYEFGYNFFSKLVYKTPAETDKENKSLK